MAWNEPGNSNNDKDPWTGKPKQNNNNTPPDLEQALRNLLKKLFGAFTGNKSDKPSTGGGNSSSLKTSGTGIGVIAGVIFAAWFLWGIFIVSPAEQAVILRLGKYVNTVGPGPHWIPRFFDSAYRVNEQKISTYTYSAEMLTRDQNLVIVSVAVQYRIANARDFLFNAVNPTESLKQATASALRQVIGHTDLDQVLTSGREQIRSQVQELLAKILDRYKTGLVITDIALQPARAPEEVKDAFDDAIRAQEDEQRFVNQAQSYAMQVEPNAKGQAQRLLTDAKAYQQQVVLRAKADTAQFIALLPQYHASPAVTRERIYLETLENILSTNTKVIVDTNNNSVFYLPLEKLLDKSAKLDNTNNANQTPSTTPTPLVPTTVSSANVNDAISDNAIDRMQGGY